MRSAYTADMLEATEATAFLLSTGIACSGRDFVLAYGADKLSLDLLPAALQRGKVSSAIAAAFADCFSMAVHFIRYASVPYPTHQAPHFLCSSGSHLPLKCCSISVVHAGLMVSTENLMRPCVKRTLRMTQFRQSTPLQRCASKLAAWSQPAPQIQGESPHTWRSAAHFVTRLLIVGPFDGFSQAPSQLQRTPLLGQLLLTHSA